MTSSLGDWLQQAVKGLAGRPEAALETRLLAAHVLQRSSTWVISHPEAPLNAAEVQHLNDLLARLEKGEPLPYLLGEWEFYGLLFEVSPAVLIPRPETELLVEQALTWLKSHSDRRVVDVGTGSGCIAVSLAKHAPRLEITAVDISAAALEVTRRNVQRHGVQTRVRCVPGDLLDGLNGPFDLVAANLPYIPSADARALPLAQYEPLSALDGGEDGLALITRLLTQLRTRLTPGGLALLEIEYRQGAAARRLAESTLPGAAVRILQDLAGKDRLLQIETLA